jgi:ABC-type nitrate/sulfonate/bicarbonate transport system substrate-binding protein
MFSAGKKIALRCVALSLFLVTASWATAEERIRAGISNFSASYISMFIASKRGYFAEEGMSLEMILIAGLLGTKAVMSNSVEFGSASNPTTAVQGAKLKMLMVFNDKPPGILAAQPGIKSVGELRGKKLGGPAVSDDELLLRYFSSEPDVELMKAAGPPQEYSSVAHPLLTLLETLTRQDKRRQVYVRTGNMSLRLEKRETTSGA